MLFRDIIGQSAIKNKLLDNLRSGRISHAQLILGESGYGTLPLALAYARYLNCQNPQPDDSCGICDSCHRYDTLEHPDLHFSFPVVTKKSGTVPVSDDYMPEWRAALKQNPYMEYLEWMQKIEAENKQGNITAKEGREIIRKLSLKPLYNGYKVMVIWQAEFLGAQGNILLKILEEPPERTLFLLVASNEDQILQTILSRCQILRVPPIEDNDIQQALMASESLGNEEAARISRLAEGNYNHAIELLKAAENDYTREFINWMRLCFKPEMHGVIKWVDSIAGTGRENQKNFLLNGLRLVRECMIKNFELDALSRYLDSENDFVTKFSTYIAEENVYDMSMELSKAHYYIERNVNPKILFFNLSLKIIELLRRRKHSLARQQGAKTPN